MTVEEMNKEYFKFYDDGYNTSKINSLTKYKTLYDKTKEEIEEKEIILESLLDSYVKEVRNIIIPFFEKDMKNAQEELSNKDDTKKENVKKMTEMLSEMFFNNDKIEIKKISACGFSTYGYMFYVACDNNTYGVQIPIIQNINTDNVENANGGKYHVCIQESQYTWKTIIESYNTKEVANKIVDVRWLLKNTNQL
jgi:hypothetical protein